MKRIIPSWLYFYRIKNFSDIFNSTNIIFIKQLNELLILNKKEYLIKPSAYLDMIENTIFEKYTRSLLSGDKSFIINFKKFLKNAHFILNRYDSSSSYLYLITGLSVILQKKFSYLALLETSKSVNEKFANIAKQILNNHGMHPFKIVCKINPHILSGFKIYCKSIRIELSYQRILKDINLNTSRFLGKV